MTTSPPQLTPKGGPRTLGGIPLGVWFKWGRWVIGLAIVVIGFWLLAGKTDELSKALHYLGHLDWWWVLIAVGAEMLSFVCFANMQSHLLKAGDVSAGLFSLSGVSVAGNVMQLSLPGGVLLSASFAFRQYRRYGADEVLAGWVIVAVTALSSITLGGIAAAGLALALSNGSTLEFAGVIAAVVVIAGLAVLGWIRRDHVIMRLGVFVRLSQRLFHHPQGEPHTLLEHAIERLGTVAPSPAQWLMAGGFAAGNWVFDCLCLALALLAVEAHVPWDGLLLAYGVAQITANLPITPGGVGVVEGSMTVALLAFGGKEASTVAGVLLYRLLSFWLVLPVGWGSWGALTIRGRLGHHNRRSDAD